MTSWIATAGRWRFGGSLLGDDEAREDDPLGFMGDGDGLCSLSPLQRLYVFAACLVAGLACMFLSMIVFFKPIKFALLFTFGNLLAIARYSLSYIPFARRMVSQLFISCCDTEI